MMKLRNKIGVIIAGLVVMLGVGLAPVGVAWADVECPAGSERAGETVPNVAQCNVPGDERDPTTGEERGAMFYVNRIINIVLGILGVVAVVVIILSGVQIATANGDPTKVKKGTQAIMYAVIGLIVALLAFAVVNFVLTSVFK